MRGRQQPGESTLTIAAEDTRMVKALTTTTTTTTTTNDALTGINNNGPTPRTNSIQEPMDYLPTPVGFAMAGLLRAVLLSMKKGALLSFVKKKAFLRLGSLTNTSSTKTAVVSSSSSSSSWMEMAKSTILGFAVFGTYESMAYHPFWHPSTSEVLNEEEQIIPVAASNSSVAPKPSAKGSSESSLSSFGFEWHESKYAQAAEQSSVMAHIGAGLCSGLAQSAVQVVWEQVLIRDRVHSLRYIQRRAIHHSIGYATLFGTYEFIRRNAMKYVKDALEHVVMVSGSSSDDSLSPEGDEGSSKESAATLPAIVETLENLSFRLQRNLQWLLLSKYSHLNPRYDHPKWDSPPSSSSNNNSTTTTTTSSTAALTTLDITPVTLCTSFLAGGIAGQVHFVVSHYTRTWLVQATHSNNNTTTTITFPKVSPIRIRPLLGSFGPTALIFLAFQFGGELSERMMAEVSGM